MWGLFYNNTYELQEVLPPTIITFQIKISMSEFGENTDVQPMEIIQNQNSEICYKIFLRKNSFTSSRPTCKFCIILSNVF